MADKNLSEQLASHLRNVHFGGNWTSVDLKTTLADVDLKTALTQVYSLNTIATLTYHIHYFISAVTKVLQGEELNAKDSFSFSHPVFQTEGDWQTFIKEIYADAEFFSGLIAELPDRKLWETFVDEKYGTYYSNIQGVIEHCHYHLGQIALIKKILQEKQ